MPTVHSCFICHNVFIPTGRGARRNYCSQKCAAKGNYLNGARKRYKSNRTELDEIACKLIDRYINMESNGSNYLNTFYIYEYGIEEKLIPSYVTMNVMKQHITRCVPKFGYERVVRRQTNALFRKVQPCETTTENECAKA
jgi:hypothetical protein